MKSETVVLNTGALVSKEYAEAYDTVQKSIDLVSDLIREHQKKTAREIIATNNLELPIMEGMFHLSTRTKSGGLRTYSRTVASTPSMIVAFIGTAKKAGFLKELFFAIKNILESEGEI